MALATGTCHLPLQGLNHVLPQLLTFNPPEGSSGWRAEKRHAVVRWVAGGTGKTGPQIVTYFWSRFYEPKSLYFLVSRKILKSFLVMTVSHDQQKAS